MQLQTLLSSRWCCLAGAWHDTRRRLCRQCCLPGCLPARPPPTPVQSFLYKMPLYSHDRLALNSKNWAEAHSHFLHAMWSLLGLMCFTLVAQAKDGLDYASDVNLPMLMNHLCKFYSYRVIRTLTVDYFLIHVKLTSNLKFLQSFNPFFKNGSLARLFFSHRFDLNKTIFMRAVLSKFAFKTKYRFGWWNILKFL